MAHISDEKLLEALLVHGSVSEAAKALECSRTTIYSRLRDPELRQQYSQLQGVVVNAVAGGLAAGAAESVAALRRVLNDPETSRGLLVNAANVVLAHTNRFIENGNILQRLDALERQAEEAEE